MPLFDYKCSTCGITTTITFRSTYIKCEYCVDGMATRRFSFSIASSMPEHYNPSIGKYVTNMNTFKDSLKRQSESATISTGIEHTFIPVTLHDRDSLGVTDQGLYETAKHKHDN